MMYSKPQNHDVKNIERAIGGIAPKFMGKIHWGYLVSDMILGWLSISLEVFIRTSFGERYINALKLFMSLATAVVILTLFGGSLTFQSPQPSIVPYRYVILVYIALCLWHKYQIYHRKALGDRWHSYSFGISRLEHLYHSKPVDEFWRRYNAFLEDIAQRSQLAVVQHLAVDLRYDHDSPWFFTRFVEAPLFVALSLIVIRFDTVLGLWINISAFALQAKNNLAYWQEHSKVLDMIDADIESRNFNDAMQGKPITQTEGFRVVPHVGQMPVPSSTDGIEDTVADVIAPTTLQSPALSIEPQPQATTSGLDVADVSATLEDVLGE